MNNVVSSQKLSPLRRAIAARMVSAKQSIPHYRLGADVEVDRVQARRKALNAGGGTSISLNDCVVKACAHALRDVPDLNLTYDGAEISTFEDVDISVVVSVPGGLATPVVRQCDVKSLADISIACRDVSERARKGSLRMPDIEGGTFSISNLGGFGVTRFDAVINAPQCAIMAVGAVERVVLPREDDGVRFASRMCVTLSLDHRILDGVVGARFLRAFRDRLEQPDWMFEQ